MTMDVSCIKPWALIQYVEERRPEKLPLLWNVLGKELEGKVDAEAFLKNTRNRIPVDTCKEAMELTKKTTQDDLAVFKAAFRFGAFQRKKRPGFFKTPFSFMKAILLQNQRSDMMAGKRIEFITISHSHIVVRVHWPKATQLNRDFCLFEQGLYQAIPKSHGLAPARLWERTCCFDGNPYCEYEIWWDPETSSRTPSLSLFFRKKDRAAHRPQAMGQILRGEDHTQTPKPDEQKEPERPSLTITTYMDEPRNRVTVNLKRPRPASEDGPAGSGNPAADDNPVTDNRAPEKTSAPPTLTVVPPDLPEKTRLYRKNQTQKEHGIEKKAMDTAESTTRPESKGLKKGPSAQARLESLSRQMGHLFDGLGRMVTLMLSEINTDHPHVEHLKRMEHMLSRGDALREQLSCSAGTEKKEQEAFSDKLSRRQSASDYD